MIPDIIDGKYRVIREVGSGGMAHVYRAINMSSRKVVAVKMLKEEYLNDKEFLRRFGLKNTEDLPDINTEKVETFKMEAEEEIGYRLDSDEQGESVILSGDAPENTED